MTKQYTCVKQGDTPQVGLIEIFPWDSNGYRPITCFRVCRAEDGLYVKMSTKEKSLRACQSVHNAPVHTDSCMEFFLMPFPEYDQRFINIEINPIGCVSSGVGEHRHDRVKLTADDIATLSVSSGIKAESDGFSWQVSYFIKDELIKKLFNRDIKHGQSMRGNFYKCGDMAPLPHWGAWNPIDNPTPDFMQSKFFGDILIP